MRFALPTLLLCALVTAHPSDDPGQWTGGKAKGMAMYGYGGGDNANGNKIYDGGVGGGIENSGTIGIGTGGGGGGGGSCDAVACDVKCKKEGDESGYCDTSADGGFLGLDLVGQTTGGCICVPNTPTSCTTTTTATATTTSTASTTDTSYTTDTTYTTDITTITSVTSTTYTTISTTTATTIPSACFCCDRSNGFSGGACTPVPSASNCPVPGSAYSHKFCCNGAGSCSPS